MEREKANWHCPKCGRPLHLEEEYEEGRRYYVCVEHGSVEPVEWGVERFE